MIVVESPFHRQSGNPVCDRAGLKFDGTKVRLVGNCGANERGYFGFNFRFNFRLEPFFSGSCSVAMTTNSSFAMVSQFCQCCEIAVRSSFPASICR